MCAGQLGLVYISLGHLQPVCLLALLSWSRCLVSAHWDRPRVPLVRRVSTGWGWDHRVLSPALGTGAQQGSQLTPDVFNISVLFNSCRAKGNHISVGNPLVCEDGGSLVWKDLVKIRCRVCTRKKTNTFLSTSSSVNTQSITSRVLPPSLYHQPHLVSLRAQVGASMVLGEPGIWGWICPQYLALFPPSTVFVTLVRELC